MRKNKWLSGDYITFCSIQEPTGQPEAEHAAPSTSGQTLLFTRRLHSHLLGDYLSPNNSLQSLSDRLLKVFKELPSN